MYYINVIIYYGNSDIFVMSYCLGIFDIYMLINEMFLDVCMDEVLLQGVGCFMCFLFDQFWMVEFYVFVLEQLFCYCKDFYVGICCCVGKVVVGSEG